MSQGLEDKELLFLDSFAFTVLHAVYLLPSPEFTQDSEDKNMTEGILLLGTKMNNAFCNR